MSQEFMLISIIIVILFIVIFLIYMKKHTRHLVAKERERMMEIMERDLERHTQKHNESIEAFQKVLKQHQKILNELKQLLENITANIQDELLIADKEGKILEVSQRFLERHQLNREQIIGTACSQYEFCKFISGNEKPCFVDRILKEKKPLQFERTLTTTNSSGKEQTHYFEITLTPIFDENNVPDKIMVICRDVTSLKMLERALFEAKRTESIGTLAGSIAHDFNNLLAGILGYASLLKSIGRDEQVIKYATNIEDSAQRGADLVRSLMRFSHQRKPQREAIVINQLVEKIAGLLQSAGRNRIKIKTVLDNNLEKIEGNSLEIEQVLLNLGLHAIDSMSGQQTGQLTLETKNVVLDENFCRYHPEIIPGRYVYVSVSDTGRGIPKEIRDRIFEPFFSTQNHFDLSGPGLAVDYAIVKNHKGYIYVYSEPGIGTIFKLYFPVLKPAPEPVATQPSLLKFDFSGKETVLFVDDDDNIRHLSREWLEKLGYTVLEASNGREALTTFQQHQNSIKAVILDMSMPELDGEHTFKEFRSIDKNIPIILTSGFSELSPSMMNEVNLTQTQGQVFFLQKPFPPEELARLLRKALQEKNQ